LEIYNNQCGAKEDFICLLHWILGKENIQCEAVENDTISIFENTGRYAFHLYIVGLYGAVVAFLLPCLHETT
jgi:hypothetical protein